MEITAVKAKTNGEFVEILLGTEISDRVGARNFLNGVFVFGAWLKSPANKKNMESIAEVFSAQVSEHMNQLRLSGSTRNEVLKNSREFLSEIHRIALDFGEKIDLAPAEEILGRV